LSCTTAAVEGTRPLTKGHVADMGSTRTAIAH
jgi:hypothetical protein